MLSCRILASLLHLKVAGRRTTRETPGLAQTYSHYQQCTIKYTAKYTYLTSRHAGVTWYYPGFPECREIKHMREQWIPGPLLRFFERVWRRGYSLSS